MKISYGPPPARGVTQLMAVGAAEFDETATDRVVKGGIAGAAVVAGLGILIGSRTLRDVGLGGACALAAVRYYARRGQVVAVTQPAPAGRY